MRKVINLQHNEIKVPYRRVFMLWDIHLVLPYIKHYIICLNILHWVIQLKIWSG